MDFLLRARSADDEEAEEKIRRKNLEQAAKRLINKGSFTMRQFDEALADARRKSEADIKFRRLMVVPYLIFASLLTYYEFSTLLDYFQWLPHRIACYACLYFYSFYGIVYKRFTYDSWCAGWITWNAPLMLYNYCYPSETVQVSEQYLVTIILLSVLRSAVYLLTGEFIKCTWEIVAAGLLIFVEACSVLFLDWQSAIIREVSWTHVPYLIIAGLLTYYECSTLLDYFEWLPVRVAWYMLAFTYPLSCVVLDRSLFDAWFIGWTTWNVPAILFNFASEKVQAPSFDQHVAHIIVFIVLRTAAYQLICANVVSSCWNADWGTEDTVHYRYRRVIDRNGNVKDIRLD